MICFDCDTKMDLIKFLEDGTPCEPYYRCPICLSEAEPEEE